MERSGSGTEQVAWEDGDESWGEKRGQDNNQDFKITNLSQVIKRKDNVRRDLST